MDSSIDIKSLTKDNKCTKRLLKEVVSVHLNAFPDFFLSTLGEKFLYTYYQCLAKHPNGVLLIAEQNGKVVAFAAATTVSGGFNTTLLKANIVSFGWCFLKLLFTLKSATIIQYTIKGRFMSR